MLRFLGEAGMRVHLPWRRGWAAYDFRSLWINQQLHRSIPSLFLEIQRLKLEFRLYTASARPLRVGGGFAHLSHT